MILERVRMAYLSMPAMLWAVQWSFQLAPIGNGPHRDVGAARRLRQRVLRGVVVERGADLYREREQGNYQDSTLCKSNATTRF